TATTPKPRSRWPATTGSMCLTWIAPCPGRHAAQAPAPAPSRCVRSGPCSEAVTARGDDGLGYAAAEAVARQSYGKLVAFLAARTRDVAAAEDALADAFAAALESWPESGCPANPEAWLLKVGRRKPLDAVRHRHSGEAAAPSLQLLAEELDATPDIGLPDHRLALMLA